MPSKTNTPDATTPAPDLSWKSATAALTAVAARDAGRGVRGIYSRWKADPAGHAVTALTTVLILAAMVLAQSARASIPASADIGPPALTRAAEMRATAVAVDTPEPTPGAQTGEAPADLLPAVARWWPQIVEAAEAHGIPPRLVACVMQQESGGQPSIESPAGAVGLMQIMPATAVDLGVTDRTDPVQSINGGARYLAQHMKSYGGDVRLALVAYNGGPGATVPYRAGRPYTESRNYIAAIMPCYERGAPDA